MSASGWYRAALTRIALGTTISLLALNAFGGCLDQARLTGVNLAGAEFNAKQLPGVVFKDYTYPNTSELSFIASKGANIIRFPFLWERLQPTPYGPFDQAELMRLKSTVKNANAQGLCVLLDVHNYAKYYSYKLTDKLPDESTVSAAFVSFWVALANEFPDPTQTAFGLMNEPATVHLTEWAIIAKQTLAALREAKATNLVIVSGGRWSGVHDWFAGLQYSNATEFDDLQDPLKRTIIEVHQYADSDYSGTHTVTTGKGCRPASEFDAKFERISTWAKEHQQTLFLGEFGVPPSSECLATLTRFLELMEDSPWRGWTYWAAGSWWGNYPLALSGPTQPAAAQWTPLQAFFYDPENPEASSPPAAPEADLKP
ncbi:MAG TPA: glycoside hydrolase family 5 protein [Cellvibrio sp.]|nr:glycoside hydrolase family 5 protein [Cellvibrio sp.]